MTEGSVVRVLVGLLGMAFGAALPPLAGSASAVYCPDCRLPPAVIIGCILYLELPPPLWAPRVAPRRPGEEATCLPPRKPGGGRVLEHAPKSPGYEPHMPPDPLYACILVGPEGDVEAVRLSPGFGGSRDLHLRQTIAEWRFDPSPGASEWVRVRLTIHYGAPVGRP